MSHLSLVHDEPLRTERECFEPNRESLRLMNSYTEILTLLPTIQDKAKIKNATRAKKQVAEWCRLEGKIPRWFLDLMGVGVEALIISNCEDRRRIERQLHNPEGYRPRGVWWKEEQGQAGILPLPNPDRPPHLVIEEVKALSIHHPERQYSVQTEYGIITYRIKNGRIRNRHPKIGFEVHPEYVVFKREEVPVSRYTLLARYFGAPARSKNWMGIQE